MRLQSHSVLQSSAWHNERSDAGEKVMSGLQPVSRRKVECPLQ